MLVLDTEKVKVLFERTLSLAKKGWGTTHPNPMVGALIVEGGEVVSEGFHVKTGHAHAEVQAISNLGRKPGSNASIFVSYAELIHKPDQNKADFIKTLERSLLINAEKNSNFRTSNIIAQRRAKWLLSNLEDYFIE